MSFSLTILGCSSALPTSTRFSSAHVLNLHERYFLIDCSEGTQIQLRKYKVKFSKINHIFISHLHGDHFFGLFGLISTFNIIGRQHELHIHAFPELQHIIETCLNIPEFQLSFPLTFHALNHSQNCLLFEDDKIEIRSFPLKHRISSCGFIFKEKPAQKNIKKEAIDKYHFSIKEMVDIKLGEDYKSPNGEIIANETITIAPPAPRSFAYCSDTIYNKRLVSVVENVDLLYHEATFMDNEKHRAKETFHSTALQAGEIAKSANVKKLVIGHFSARYKDLTPLLNEAKSVFENTVLASDGLKIEV